MMSNRFTFHSANIADSCQCISKQKQMKLALVSLGSEHEIQVVTSIVGKLIPSGTVICLDLPPKLNLRGSELLTKSREMKSKG